MSAPERIWAWWEFDNDHRAINQWEDEIPLGWVKGRKMKSK